MIAGELVEVGVDRGSQLSGGSGGISVLVALFLYAVWPLLEGGDS